MTIASSASLAGQGAVGQFIVVPWWPGTYEMSQGWGATDYTGEPAGHGFANWHAGVDVAAPSGTLISLPHGLTGTARYLDNPGGYGTALVVELAGGVDILFGHLRQRLVGDGQVLRGGEQLAASNNTGNSTGAHVHFEVRPHGGRYGTDIDPSAWLLDPAGATAPGGDVATLATDASGQGNPYNVLDPRHNIWDLEHSLSTGVDKALATALGAGQVALGSGMMIGGLVAVSFGLRGRDAGQLVASGRSTWRGVQAGQRRRSGEEYQRERSSQGEIAAGQRDVAAAGAQAGADQAAVERVRRSRLRPNLQKKARLGTAAGTPTRRRGRSPEFDTPAELEAYYTGQGIPSRKPARRRVPSGVK